MHYEHTIDDLITRYPALYPNRTYVMDMLFCNEETGFRWREGELIEVFRDTAPPSVTVKDHLNTVLTAMFPKVTEEILSDIANKRDELMKWFKQAQEIPRDTYAQIGYQSNILHVPADVTPGWLKGVLEMLALLQTDVNIHNQLVADRTMELYNEGQLWKGIKA